MAELPRIPKNNCMHFQSPNHAPKSSHTNQINLFSGYTAAKNRNSPKYLNAATYITTMFVPKHIMHSQVIMIRNQTRATRCPAIPDIFRWMQEKNNLFHDYKFTKKMSRVLNSLWYCILWNSWNLEGPFLP